MPASDKGYYVNNRVRKNGSASKLLGTPAPGELHYPATPTVGELERALPYQAIKECNRRVDRRAICNLTEGPSLRLWESGSREAGSKLAERASFPQPFPLARCVRLGGRRSLGAFGLSRRLASS